MSISIVLPSYKEAENLKILLPKLEAELININSDYEILIIDTTKKMDNTEEVCKNYKNVKYIPRANGNNYGDAIRTGIQYSSKNYIVFMDADGSHSPQKISEMLYQINTGYDLIICSRYIKGGNSHNPLILKLMSIAVNLCYRIVFNLKVKDVSNSFRMYKSNMIKNISLECNNFDIVEEILIKLCLKYKDIKIKEIPIFFDKRIYGESKRDLVKFIFSYLTTIIKLLKIKSKFEKLN